MPDPGFDRHHTPERPTATIAQVFALADAMPPRFTALIIVAALSGLRWGELAALRRCDIDLATKTVRVPRKLATLRTGLEFGPPRSEAGRRTVALPDAAVQSLTGHLAAFVGEDPEALVFTGEKGAPLRAPNFRRAVTWEEALAGAGIAGDLHFHDLRHTGNTLAAAAGASTRELMHRMGHSSMRAALIYQHATSKRDPEIASGIDARIRAERLRPRGALHETAAPAAGTPEPRRATARDAPKVLPASGTRMARMIHKRPRGHPRENAARL